MVIENARRPVIILGMSRSGTTLLARLLERLGLYLGHKQVDDLEAAYFHGVNRMIFKRAHGYWDNPGPMRHFLRNPAAVEQTVRSMERDLRSYRVIRYLGLRNYFRCRSLSHFDRPWGWKDPQTVFTLPLWLRLFPGAKVVYIVRNGVDVAHSLCAMERRVIARRRERAQGRSATFAPKSHLERFGFKGAARSLSLEGAFSLWEEYVSQAEDCLAGISNGRRVLRFEDFLSNPREHLLDLSQFCELRVAESSIDELARSVVPERAHAYNADPALQRFYEIVRAGRWMVHYGYSDPGAAPGGAGSASTRGDV